jgi:2,4-dienoyl-CoA reductase-like NADH-dependent reductase (Old Yellow Enzyme family)
VEESVRFALLLAEKGVDFLDVTTGGNHPLQKIKPGPAYQAPFAKAIKKAVGDKMLVGTVGAITTGALAEELVSGSADEDGVALDIIAVGRPFQKNPGLVWAWAEELQTSIYLPKQIGWGFGGRATRLR